MFSGGIQGDQWQEMGHLKSFIKNNTPTKKISFIHQTQLHKPACTGREVP